ncbi:MAG: hypothetical protein PVI99_01675 [Anaerolineales bacterium]|jgi:hypothetical protein
MKYPKSINICISIFYLSTLVILAACSRQTDVSILRDITEKPLSYREIILNETTKEEAHRQIASYEEVVPDSIVYPGNPQQFFDVVLWFELYPNIFNESSVYASAEFIGGRIFSILFCGQDDTIGDAVEKFGEPDYLVVTPDSEYGGWTVDLVYPETGIHFFYSTSEVDYRTEITPDIKISCLVIFDPNIYPDMLDSGFFSQYNFNGEDTLKILYSWRGYGELEEMYPFREP